MAAAAAAKSLQSCLTLCDPIDGSPPGSLVPRILQAKTLDPFWPEEFLLKDQLLSLWESSCVLFVVFPLLLLIFVLCV